MGVISVSRVFIKKKLWDVLQIISFFPVSAWNEYSQAFEMSIMTEDYKNLVEIYDTGKLSKAGMCLCY